MGSLLFTQQKASDHEITHFQIKQTISIKALNLTYITTNMFQYLYAAK